MLAFAEFDVEEAIVASLKRIGGRTVYGPDSAPGLSMTERAGGREYFEAGLMRP